MEFGLVLEDSAFGWEFVRVSFKEKPVIKHIYRMNFVSEIVFEKYENVSIQRGVFWKNAFYVGLKDLSQKRRSIVLQISPTRIKEVDEVEGDIYDMIARENEVLYSGDFGIEGYGKEGKVKLVEKGFMENVLGVEVIHTIRAVGKKLYFAGYLTTHKLFEFPRAEPIEEFDSAQFSFDFAEEIPVYAIDDEILIEKVVPKKFEKEKKGIYNVNAFKLDEKRVLVIYDNGVDVKYLLAEKVNNEWVVRQQDILVPERDYGKVISIAKEEDEETVKKLIDRYAKKLL